ncbi:hypothetical protein [Enterococcus phage vB_Efs30_KEN14]
MIPPICFYFTLLLYYSILICSLGNRLIIKMYEMFFMCYPCSSFVLH